MGGRLWGSGAGSGGRGAWEGSGGPSTSQHWPHGGPILWDLLRATWRIAPRMFHRRMERGQIPGAPAPMSGAPHRASRPGTRRLCVLQERTHLRLSFLACKMGGSVSSFPMLCVLCCCLVAKSCPTLSRPHGL